MYRLFRIQEDFERRLILEKLERWDWSQKEVAEHLHIPLSALKQKVKRLKLVITEKGKE